MSDFTNSSNCWIYFKLQLYYLESFLIRIEEISPYMLLDADFNNQYTETINGLMFRRFFFKTYYFFLICEYIYVCVSTMCLCVLMEDKRECQVT